MAVTADIISDGHDIISAELLYRRAEEKKWTAERMLHTVNDKWKGVFTVKEVGTYFYTLRAWVDHFYTWQQDLIKRIDAGQNIKVELLIGAEMVEHNAANADTQEIKRKLETIAEKMKDPDDMQSASELASE